MNAESNHPPLITRLTTPLTSARTNAETSISASLRWSVDELGQAIGYLAQKSAPALASAETVRAARLEGAPIQSKAMDDAALARWIELLADRVGLEAEPTRATYAETGRFLESAGPALVRLAQASSVGDGGCDPPRRNLQ